MTQEQETIPGVPLPQKIIRVTIHGGNKRLRVDAADWDAATQDERDEMIYEAAQELGWFDCSFEEIT
jgi:hypothetical protein